MWSKTGVDANLFATGVSVGVSVMVIVFIVGE